MQSVRSVRSVIPWGHKKGDWDIEQLHILNYSVFGAKKTWKGLKDAEAGSAAG